MQALPSMEQPSIYSWGSASGSNHCDMAFWPRQSHWLYQLYVANGSVVITTQFPYPLLQWLVTDPFRTPVEQGGNNKVVVKDEPSRSDGDDTWFQDQPDVHDPQSYTGGLSRCLFPV